MITYNALDLYSSGPATTRPGELTGRHAVSNTPGTSGSAVISQGLSPRLIVQQGLLIGDDETALQQLVSAIEAEVGRGEAELIDEQGRVWPGCVLQSFEPNAPQRLGPRLSAAYTMTYLQATP